MTFLSVFFIVLYVLVCIFLILVVLLQQGKGADLAGAFGGGGSQTSFGPRTSTNIMHRLTTISFVAFVVLSMGLAILAGKHRSASVVSEQPTPTPIAESEHSEPALDAEPGSEAPAGEAETPADEAMAPTEGTTEEAAGAEPAAEAEAPAAGETTESSPENDNGA